MTPRPALRHLLLFAVLAVSVAVAPAAFATRVARMTLTEVRDDAATIVRGTVAEATARLDATGSMVWTDYSVRIDEVLAGAPRRGNVTISIGGGSTPEKSVIVAGSPMLQIGETYLFFLEQERPTPLLVPSVGWGQGIYQLVYTTRGEQAMVSVDGEPVEVVASGELRRGAAVEVTDGRIVDRDPRRIAAEASADEGTRRALPEPLARNADGSAATMTPAPPRQEALAPRRFATYAELVEFIRGERGEQTAPGRSHRRN